MNTSSILQAASFVPRSIQSPNAWIGHLPFAAWIIREIKPTIFVELGTHSGNSYFSFCQSVLECGLSTKCYAVDTWQGDTHSGKYDDDIFHKLEAHNNDNYKNFSQLLRMTFDEAEKTFENESIDLLHIDGLHTYDAVQHDFNTWLPKLSPGAVVIFHDTNVHERDFGVWRFWQELQKLHTNNLEFTHSHGLGVLQLCNTPNDKKCTWLQGDSNHKRELIKYFSSLGLYHIQQYASKKNITNLNNSMSERDRHILTLEKEINRIINTFSWRVTKPLRLVANLPGLVKKKLGH